MARKSNNLFLFSAVFSVNTLAFYCGSTYSWTSPVIPKLRSNDTSINPLSRPITIFEETWLGSGFILGCLFGAFTSALVAGKIGRKKTLIMFSSFLFISFGSFIFIKNLVWYLIGRFIMGLATGCILATLPSYVGEITEDSNRGISGSVFGIAFSIGHLLNYGVGPFVSLNVLDVLHLVPLCLFYITFVPFIPESPYYFISKDDTQGAKRSLRKLRGHSMIGEELEEIRNSVLESQKNKCSFTDMFKSHVVKKGLFVSCGLLICQQITGVCAVLAYLQPIFEASGGFIPAEFSVLIVGVCQLIANISTAMLVEKLGRKVLVLISSSGSAVCLTFLGLYFYLQGNDFNVKAISWLPVVSLLIFIFSINIGLASVPWTVSAEIFASSVKATATGFATAVNIITTLIVMSIFPSMSIVLGMPGCFWVFAALSVVAVVFIVLVVPETKGKSLDEIQELLKNGK